MENYASFLVNTAFIVSCAFMGIVFLVLPLPTNKGLRKYRISLWFLAGAYLGMAGLKGCILAFDQATINLLSVERLTISSLQATQFTIALIALLSPQFLSRRNLYVQIIPLVILNVVYLVVATRWGNPVIGSFRELSEAVFQPAMLIRELFSLFYIAQLVYLTRIFILHARIYENKIDNYFADNYTLQLPWVRYCYYAALSIGISAFLSCFIVSESVLLFFNGLYAIFYLVFGICYIQYPRTYLYIEPVIYPPVNIQEEPSKNIRRLAWNELKSSIIAEKYYLHQEVNIEDMARYLKIGRTTLSRFINNEEGMNFNSWINLLRIEEAKLLFVKYPDYTLIEISEMVGYSESSNFSRQFKLITSKSPSIWRQAHKTEYTAENQTFHSGEQLF